ncbi:MAG: hypothetical protein WEA29_02860 [Acidimicrobiia bacterium]
MDSPGDPDGRLPRTRSGYRLITIAAIVGSLVTLYLGRNLWFFGDEFAFILDRSATSLADLMRPHNEHWSIVPILVYRSIFSVVSLSSYLPYLGALAVINASIGTLAGVILRKAGAPLGVAALVALGVTVLGAGAENLVWAFQIGFTLSLATALAVVLVLGFGDRSRREDWLAASLLVLGVASSGIGFAGLAGAVVALVLQRDWRRLARVVGPAAVIGVAWLSIYRGAITGSHGSPSITETLLLLPRYVGTGLTAALDAVIGFGIGVGFAALVAVIVALVAWFGGHWRPPITVSMPLAAAAAMYVSTGIARAQHFGIEQAASSRYTHVGGVLLTVGLGSALVSSQTFRRHWRHPAARFIITGALCIAALAHVAALREFAHNRTGLTDPTRDGVVAAILAIESDESAGFIPWAQPVPRNPDVSAESLAAALDSGQLRLGDSDRGAVGAEQIAVATASMKAQWTEPGRVPAASAMLIEQVDVEVERVDGCVVVTPLGPEAHVVLAVARGGAISFASSGPGTAEAFIDTVGGFATAPALWRELAPDQPVDLVVAQAGDRATLVRVSLVSEAPFGVCATLDT